MPTVLAIDPSSTRTGYAVMADAMTIIDAGLLKPGKVKDPWLHRVRAMTIDLRGLLREVEPDIVLVEIPHKHNAPHHKNLAAYGFAAGAMWAECFDHTEETHAVSAEVWTGKKSKSARQLGIDLMYPSYDPAKDKGGDIADAIGLARWWFRQQKAQRIVRSA